VRAILRRAQLPPTIGRTEVIEADGVRIDLVRRSVEVGGEQVQLTYLEFELLRTLAASPGRVFSRRELLDMLWGGAEYRDPRTIDVHVRHLREKIEPDPREPAYIFTMRGAGYRFRDGS
jgi:DNA-binding response OmpR family regulator